MARTFETNIAINAVPTAPNHAARLADLVDVPGVEPPSFAGTIDPSGDMVFYLSPDGDDANGALSQSSPGQSLSVLLDWIKASDHTLPRFAGVHIFLFAGEYNMPWDYDTPVLNRSLTISGRYPDVAYAKTVIINADTWRFYSDRFIIRYLTIRAPSVYGLLFARANVILKSVYFEGGSVYAVNFDASNVFMSACAFEDALWCISLSNESTLVYLHDEAVRYPTEDNMYFLQSENSVATFHNYNEPAPFGPNIDPSSRIRFERLPGFLDAIPTGQHFEEEGVAYSQAPVYNYVFTGTITAEAGEVFLEWGPGAKQVLNWGGWWAINSTTTVSVSTIRRSPDTWASLELHLGGLVFITCHSSARTNMPYRIWVEYTKV